MVSKIKEFEKKKEIPTRTYILSTLCLLFFISGLINDIGFTIGAIFLIIVCVDLAYVGYKEAGENDILPTH